MNDSLHWRYGFGLGPANDSLHSYLYGWQLWIWKQRPSSTSPRRPAVAQAHQVERIHHALRLRHPPQGQAPDADSPGAPASYIGPAGATGATGLGASGDTFAYPDINKPPATPSIYDDEFNSTTLDAKWTQINWASGLTSYDVNTTVPSSLYTIRVGTANLASIVQPLPVGDYTIITKVTLGGGANYYSVGLSLGSTNTLGTGSQVLIDFQYNGGLTRRTEVFTNWTTQGTQIIYSPVLPGLNYIRTRRSGTTYYAGWFDTGYVLPQNRWLHLAWVINSGVLVSFYIDGRFFTSMALGVLSSIPGTMCLGTSGISEYFYGRMKDVRVYNRLLTYQEVYRSCHARPLTSNF